MTAISAFAPTPRNQFLRHVAVATSPSQLRTTATVTVTSVALFLWILSYWRRRWRHGPSEPSTWKQWWRTVVLTSGFSSPTIQEHQHHDDNNNINDDAGPNHVVSVTSESPSTLHDAIKVVLTRLQRWMQRATTTTTTTITSATNGVHDQRHHRHQNDTSSNNDDNVDRSSDFDTLPNGHPDGNDERNQENRQLIHQVLMYWFGQYPPDQAQRQLWMIASSSVEARTRVDAEITSKFGSLLLDLSSSSSSLEDTDGGHSRNSNNRNIQRLEQWTHDTSSFGYQGKVAAIIVLDQMARHVRRFCCDTDTNMATTSVQTSTSDATVTNLNTTSINEVSNATTIDHTTSSSTTPLFVQRLRELLPEQAVLDQLAYHVSLQFQQEHADEITCGMVPLPMHVFALMPLRHHAAAATDATSSIPTLAKVQDEIEQVMAPLQPQMQALVQRFRKATNRRMAVLQDEARRQGKRPPQLKQHIAGDDDVSQPSRQEQSSNEANGASNNHKTGSVDDSKADDDDDIDILEHVFFEADMSLSHQHPVHQAIVQFLAHRNIVPQEITADDVATKPKHKHGHVKQRSPQAKGTTNDDEGTKPESTATTELSNGPKIQQQSPKEGARKSDDGVKPTSTTTVAPMIVSLSGGVDSMVVATVLAHLRDKCNYPHLRVAAVHIDYANRPESGAEADFCARYCQQIGIDFTCRRIGEVTRGITARDEYERRAREIRFQEYRKAISKAQQAEQEHAAKGDETKSSGDDPVVVGVVLGHHRGDLRENVLSNAHKGCGPLDLSGMTDVSLNDGVTIYRPLLPLEKTAIFDYAHKFGVPYFKDTTPHWSTRGKLRNKLLPLLEEIYGEGSMNNLSALANESDEARSLLYHTVLGPFLNQVSHRPMGIYFDTAPWKLQGLYFWKLVLRETLHKAGLGMFKDKSVVSFCERIQATKLRAGWLQCRRDYAVYLKEDGRVFVIYPGIFPWRKEDSFSSFVGQVVPYGEDNSATVGPWSVTSQIVEPAPVSSVQSQLLGTKAVSSMEHFMDGCIEYYLRVPSISHSEATPRPLAIVSDFTRESRPLAWKSCDVKIQSTLPILGYDGMLGSAMKAKVTTENKADRFHLVKVTLQLKHR